MMTTKKPPRDKMLRQFLQTAKTQQKREQKVLEAQGGQRVGVVYYHWCKW